MGLEPSSMLQPFPCLGISTCITACAVCSSPCRCLSLCLFFLVPLSACNDRVLFSECAPTTSGSPQQMPGCHVRCRSLLLQLGIQLICFVPLLVLWNAPFLWMP